MKKEEGVKSILANIKMILNGSWKEEAETLT